MVHQEETQSHPKPSRIGWILKYIVIIVFAVGIAFVFDQGVLYGKYTSGILYNKACNVVLTDGSKVVWSEKNHCYAINKGGEYLGGLWPELRFSSWSEPLRFSDSCTAKGAVVWYYKMEAAQALDYK